MSFIIESLIVGFAAWGVLVFIILMVMMASVLISDHELRKKRKANQRALYDVNRFMEKHWRN